MPLLPRRGGRHTGVDYVGLVRRLRLDDSTAHDLIRTVLSATWPLPRLAAAWLSRVTDTGPPEAVERASGVHFVTQEAQYPAK